MDKHLLFGLQAVQLGLVRSAVLVDAGLACSRGEAQDLREEIARRGGLQEEQLELLDRAVDAVLEAHGGDATASLDGLGGRRRVLESFGGALEWAEPPTLQLGKTPPRPAEGQDAPAPVAAPATAGSPAVEKEVPDKGESAEERVTPEAPDRYRTHEEIGRGGIGRVFSALDAHVGREIAIKELLVEGSGSLDGPKSASGKTMSLSTRFLREAKLTAQLEHPSIVPVYEVGRRPDGTLYYSMRLVRGRTLEKAIQQAPSVRERVDLLPHFSSLCSAVAYAHSRGVLHRDLKPQNVMIGEFGETVLLDWGLAKIKGAQEQDNDQRFARQIEALRQVAAGKTVAGEALGTPEYMPPEQAWGELDAVDERSDVYSLGAVLYELLTGTPPFDGPVAYDIIGKVQAYGQGRDRLVAVREREPLAPPELAAIAEKALAADRADRYPDAKSLLNDVNAFMAGHRVAAYDYNSWELLQRFVSKNRAVSAMAGLLFLMLLFGSGALLKAYRSAEGERAGAQENERLAHQHLASAFQEKAERLLADRDLLGARIFASAALIESPFNPAGRFFDAAATRARPADRDAQIASLQSTLDAAGRALATLDTTLRGHELTVASLAFSPDGQLLASGSHDRTVRLWPLDRPREPVVLTGHDEAVAALAFSPDGAMLASGAADGSVRLWSRTGEPLGSLVGHEDGVVALTFSPDGKHLASSSRDRSVRIWDLHERTMRVRIGTSLAGHDGVPDSLAFVAGGELLATAGPDRTIRLYAAPAGAPAGQLEGHAQNVRSIVASPDGERLLSLGDDETVRSWRVADRSQAGSFSLDGGRHRAFAVVFTPDGGIGRVAVSSRDTTQLYEGPTGDRRDVVGGHLGAVRAIAFSAQGRLLATAGTDRRIRVWRLDEKGPLLRLKGHGAPILALSLSRDGRRAATAGRDRTVRVWDLATGRSLPPLRGHEEEINAVALAPDGRTAVSGGRDRAVRVWDVERGAASATLSGHRGGIAGLSFSPDGKLFASAGREGEVRLWSATDRKLVQVLGVHEGGAMTVAFSPTGRLLASGGRDRAIRLWDLEKRAVLRTLHTAETVRALAFSPNGALLASGDFSWVVRIWDVGEGHELQTLVGHADGPRALSFSPDGAWLASAGGSDHSIRLWELAGMRLLQVFRHEQDALTVGFGAGDVPLLFAADGADLVHYPLRLGLWRQDPRNLFDLAQREAGMMLEGFSLVPR